MVDQLVVKIGEGMLAARSSQYLLGGQQMIAGMETMEQSHYQSPCYAPREYDAWEEESCQVYWKGMSNTLVTGDSGGRRSGNGMRWKRWVLWLTQL